MKISIKFKTFLPLNQDATKRFCKGAEHFHEVDAKTYERITFLPGNEDDVPNSTVVAWREVFDISRECGLASESIRIVGINSAIDE